MFAYALMTEMSIFPKLNLNLKLEEFFSSILVEVSGIKLESSQTEVFVWVSPLFFPFYYNMLYMNRLEFSCFADFVCFFRPEWVVATLLKKYSLARSYFGANKGASL
jgi:hypothetical protein